MQVLLLIAVGYSDGEIADELRLTRGTVHRYSAGMRDRLHARNRAHAVALALSMGLLVIDGSNLRAA